MGPNGMPPHAQDCTKMIPILQENLLQHTHPRRKKTTSLLSTIYVKIKGVWKIHRTTQVSNAEFTHSAGQPILLKGKSAPPPNHWWRKSYSEILTPQLNGSCKRKQTIRCFFFWSSFFLSFSSVTRLYGIIRLYRPCRSAPLIFSSFDNKSISILHFRHSRIPRSPGFTTVSEYQVPAKFRNIEVTSKKATELITTKSSKLTQ